MTIALATSMLILAVVGRAWAAAPQEAGLTAAELLRGIGIVAAVVAILGLVLIHFVYRRRLRRVSYHWGLFAFMFALPAVALLGAWETVFEETKEVSSCNSCHVMNEFVADLTDPHSATLAARHFQNKWIPSDQCYQCHSTYGFHGTLLAKRDGFRHWLLYVTETWDEPIEYSGSYPNVNCINCHADTPAFNEISSHEALGADLETDRVTCVTCHGPPHPPVVDRPVLAEDLRDE